jgi:tetratricopeptide (TPR) repeat protein
MMGKFVIFSALWWLTGNPFVALIVLIVILYALDRRFLGITPNVFRPFTLRRKLSRLRQELLMNRHDRSARLEQARVLIDLKRYADARNALLELEQSMDESADVLAELGLCSLKLGSTSDGERYMLKALELNPRVKFGEPYLRLGEAFADVDAAKAIGYLEQFQQLHSSSCEAYYRLGQIYKRLGRSEEAKRAFRETVDVYGGLPKYKKRTERRYALLARLQA